MHKTNVNWRRAIALAVPVAVVLFTLGVVAALELYRGPNWRLELNEYVAHHTSPTETVRIAAVTRASKPWNFSADMGIPEPGDWIVPSYPPQAVRCVLLVRSPSANAAEGESLRQVVFLVHHSDALYRVGWLAYAGPEEPFGPEIVANLTLIGCDLGLE
jgi:hypothetical protein